MRRPRHRVTAIALILAASGPLGCSHPAGTRPPVVRIIATDRGFEIPARVAAGITEFRLVNHGRLMHEGVFMHFLTPDGTTAAFVDSVRAGIDVPAFAEDSGGPGLAAPGDSTRVWLDLAPGHYGVTCWYASHIDSGQARDFDVVPAVSRAVPPASDLTVRMVDYNYRFEGDWSAGHHIVRVVNEGSETHEFDPYRLEPGRTVADFTYWLEHKRVGPAPAIALGGSGTFQPGHQEWLPLTLVPGRYFAFCQMPAKVGGRAHYQMGMVREFVVR